MNKSKIISLIIGSEKGLNTDEPESVGGVSFDGVSQKTYTGYLTRIRGLFPDAPDEVEYLATRPEIVEHFYDLYLGDFNTWLLPEFLWYIYSDFAVNAGSAAAKIIQRMVSVPDDGIIGSGTKKAIGKWKADVEQRLSIDPNVDNEVIMHFHNEKIAHYEMLVNKNPDKFQKWYSGWIRRANHVLSQLQEYFEVPEGTPSAMDDDDVIVDPDQYTPDTKPLETPRGAAMEARVAQLERDIKTLKERLAEVEKSTGRTFKPRLMEG